MSSLTDGQVRKINGQEAALNWEKEQWKDAVLQIIRELARKKRFLTCDDVRLLANVREIPPPQTHASWGAIFRIAAKQKIIQKTKRFAISTLKTNNAGIRYIWRSVIY